MEKSNRSPQPSGVGGVTVEQIYVEIDGLLIPLDMERVNKDWLNTLEKQLC